MGKKEKQAKNTVASQVNVLLAHKYKTPLPDGILVDALDGYWGTPLSTGALTQKAKRIAERIRGELPDAEVLVRSVRSLSRDKVAAAVGIYGVRPASMEHATFFGAYFHSLVFAPERCLFHSAIEPAGTNSHLYERIISRSNHPYSTFTEAQGRLSDFWPVFVEAGQSLRLDGKPAAPIQYFASSWADGLMFGEMQTMRVDESLGAPYVVEFKDRVGIQTLLPDFYSTGGKRLLAFFKTFIGPDQLKPDQLELRDKLDKFRAKHAEAIGQLKTRWQIGSRPDHPFSLEIARVMGFPNPGSEKVEVAVAEMVDLVTSETWLSEAEKNRENAERARERARIDPEIA